MNREGFSSLITILVTVAIILAGGAVWYFSQDTYRDEWELLSARQSGSQYFDTKIISSQTYSYKIVALDDGGSELKVYDLLTVTVPSEADSVSPTVFNKSRDVWAWPAGGNGGNVAIYWEPDEFMSFRIYRMTDQTSQNESSIWKTYRNEQYGFEIKYPADWKIWEQFGTNVSSIVFNGELNGNRIEAKASPYIPYGLQIFSDKQKPGYSNYREETYGNVKWHLRVVEDREGGYENIEYYTEYNDKLYVFSVLNKKEYLDILNRILSTFRFISQTSPN